MPTRKVQSRGFSREEKRVSHFFDPPSAMVSRRSIGAWNHPRISKFASSRAAVAGRIPARAPPPRPAQRKPGNGRVTWAGHQDSAGRRRPAPIGGGYGREYPGPMRKAFKEALASQPDPPPLVGSRGTGATVGFAGYPAQGDRRPEMGYRGVGRAGIGATGPENR